LALVRGPEGLVHNDPVVAGQEVDPSDRDRT